jgi:hypothetical protein
MPKNHIIYTLLIVIVSLIQFIQSMEFGESGAVGPDALSVVEQGNKLANECVTILPLMVVVQSVLVTKARVVDVLFGHVQVCATMEKNNKQLQRRPHSIIAVVR